MNFGPLDVAPIVDRWRLAATDFRAIGTTVDIALAMDANDADPCGYVVLASEQGSKREGASGVYRQRCTATIGFLIGLRVYGTQTGGEATPEMIELIKSTREGLLNWIPPGAVTVLEFVDGRILRMDVESKIWWLERYRCDYWLDSQG